MKHVYFLFVMLMLVACEKTHASNIILEWDPSTSADVAGYDVYYGTNSGNYIYTVDAGNSTSATISNLVPGLTYYFVATAYDAAGDQSSFSSEISYTVPIVFGLVPGSGPGNFGVLQFPVAQGHSYEVQATTDLQNWTSLWQSDVVTADSSMQFTDPDAASFASRFYRLVTH